MVLLPTYVCHDLLPERPHSNLLDVLRYNHHIFQGLLQLRLPFFHYLSGIRMVRSHHGRLQTDQYSVFPVKMADLYLPRVIVHPEGFLIFYNYGFPQCRIDWNLIFSAEHTKSLNMIHMFMCDQDTFQFISFYLQFCQPFFYPFLADTGINQKMSLIISYIDAVSTASTCNTA